MDSVRSSSRGNYTNKISTKSMQQTSSNRNSLSTASNGAEKLFNSSFGLKLNQDQIVGEIINFMQAEPSRRYKVIIGSDSERNGDTSADFVTAVVVHRVGNGGRYFWRHYVMTRNFHTIRERILEEVLMSLDVAKDILGRLKEKSKLQPALDWDFEIHVDVGANGATRTMIQELVGMVRANNFEAKTKPDSYAASKVADRHV